MQASQPQMTFQPTPKQMPIQNLPPLSGAYARDSIERLVKALPTAEPDDMREVPLGMLEDMEIVCYEMGLFGADYLDKVQLEIKLNLEAQQRARKAKIEADKAEQEARKAQQEALEMKRVLESVEQDGIRINKWCEKVRAMDKRINDYCDKMEALRAKEQESSKIS